MRFGRDKQSVTGLCAKEGWAQRCGGVSSLRLRYIHAYTPNSRTKKQQPLGRRVTPETTCNTRSSAFFEARVGRHTLVYFKCIVFAAAPRTFSTSGGDEVSAAAYSVVFLYELYG
jgi:hypothetical protein